MASPLHQFELKPLIPFEWNGINLAFTNSSLFMVMTVVLAALIMLLPTRRSALIPSRWQSIPEMLYEFIYGIVRDMVGSGGMKYLPMVFSLFMLVLIGNLLGMMPYGFTITSHIIITAALGALVILTVTIMGFVNHGWHFLSLFAPSGLPKIMYLILIPIEIISFLSRPVTLAVRLGANMMAGHMVLKVFALFSVMLLTAGGVMQLFSVVPMIMNVLLVALELMVAILQAYIFTILTCVYIKDAVELHH